MVIVSPSTKYRNFPSRRAHNSDDVVLTMQSHPNVKFDRAGPSCDIADDRHTPVTCGEVQHSATGTGCGGGPVRTTHPVVMSRPRRSRRISGLILSPAFVRPMKAPH